MVTGSKSVQALVFYIYMYFFPFKNLHSAFKYTNLVRSFFYTQFQYECAAITKSKDGSRTVKYSLGRLMRSDANWLVRGR